MDLLFKKLTLENFRIYQGMHYIEFSTDSKKHLTVVHAENSTGKTTMLNSIKWCLYGETPDFTDSKNLVNDRCGKSTCSVRLNFVYDNKEYSAYRVYTQTTRESRLTLNEISKSGAHSPIDEPDSAIDNILPKDLSNYFLFAGEHFTGALGTDDRVSHRRAIRDILGFTLPELAIEDIGYLIKKNKRALTSILEEEDDTRAVAKEVVLLTADLESLKDGVVKTNEDIRQQQEIKKISQEYIDKSNHLKAQALNKTRKEKEQQLNQERDGEKGLLIQKQRLVSKYGLALFGKKLADTSLDFIKTEKRRIPAPYDQRFVNELLGDHMCICERELKEGTREYEAVKSMVSSASTETIDQRAQKAISIGDSFDKKAGDFLQEVNRIEKDLKATITKISGFENSIKQIDNDIEAIGNVDISAHKDSVRDAEQKILALAERLGADKRTMSIRESALRSKNQELTKLSPKNNKHKKFEDFDVVAKKTLKRIESELEKTEKPAGISNPKDFRNEIVNFVLQLI